MRRMSRRFQKFEHGISKSHFLTFLEFDMIKCNRRILHKTDFGARSGTKFLVAADVIGMNMGFKNMRDFHAIVTGQVDVVPNITFGIHNTGNLSLGQPIR